MGTSEFARVEGFVPEPYAQHGKDLARKLGDTVRMAKERRLSSEQKELDQQALNLRNLAKNVSIANKMRDDVLGLCAAVAKARQSGDHKGVVTAKAAIAQAKLVASQAVERVVGAHRARGASGHAAPPSLRSVRFAAWRATRGAGGTVPTPPGR